MSWKSAWKKAKKKIKKAAKAIENAVHEVGDAVGTVVEAVGAAISDGSNWAGDHLGPIGVVFYWLGGLAKGVLDLVAAVVKGVCDIVGGIIGGVIQIVGGIVVGVFSLGDFGLIGEGLRDILTSIVGAVLVVLGKAWAVIQSLVTGWWVRERKLSKDERAALERVFRDTLYYYLIRIVEGHGGLFQISDRPFTLGNTIYLNKNPETSELLVHEATHVWQYQNLGVRYAADAAGAQAFVPDEYSWEREIRRGNARWVEWNKEAQGKFLEDLWRVGVLHDQSGDPVDVSPGSFYLANGKVVGHFQFNTVNRTSIANDAVETVRDNSRLF